MIFTLPLLKWSFISFNVFSLELNLMRSWPSNGFLFGEGTSGGHQGCRFQKESAKTVLCSLFLKRHAPLLQNFTVVGNIHYFIVLNSHLFLLKVCSLLSVIFLTALGLLPRREREDAEFTPQCSNQKFPSRFLITSSNYIGTYENTTPFLPLLYYPLQAI